MGFPTNGRVVVVDNEIEEATPLIEALSRRGIACRYFTGRSSELPKHPLNGVRLIFLDMMLEGMDFTTDSEDVVSQLRAVLSRLIDEKNGPYIVFGWTKNPKHLAVFEERISPKPILCLDMEKSDCIADGKCDVDVIQKKLEEQLSKIGSLRILFEWENLANDSGCAVVNQIVETSAPPGTLDSTLFNIARASLGKRGESASPEQLTRSALQVFNALLSDAADISLSSATLPGSIARDEAPLSIESAGKINSKMLLGIATEALGYPGNVYIEQTEEGKTICASFLDERISPQRTAKSFRKKLEDDQDPAYIKGDKDAKQKIVDAKVQQFRSGLKKVPLVFLEISPVCDHAQGIAKYHRILPGFLLPYDFAFSIDRVQNDIALYTTPVLYLDKFKAPFYLTLDLRGLRTISLHALEGAKPLFRIGQALLFDIQHKAGAHFNRPGIFSIG